MVHEVEVLNERSVILFIHPLNKLDDVSCPQLSANHLVQPWSFCCGKSSA